MAARYYFDASAVIAILETKTPTPAQARFLAAIEDGETQAASSELTLSECLVRPLREGDTALVAATLAFLDGRAELPLAPVGRSTMILAAELRAALGIGMAEALHVACARESECTVMISGDAALRLPPGMARLGWDDIGR